jgi:hypothetical protein
MSSREAPRACGTAASYRRHLRAGEQTCPDCRRAHADAVNAFRASRRASTVVAFRLADRVACPQATRNEATA